MQVQCDRCRSRGEVGPPEHTGPGLLTCPHCGAPISIRPVRLPDGQYMVESAKFERDGHGNAILRPLYRPGERIAGGAGDEPWTGCRVRVGEREMVIGPSTESRAVTF